MLVQFGNNWIQKIPLTAKLDSACGLVQFWLSSEFFSSNYFQIGQHVVLLHIRINNDRIVKKFCCTNYGISFGNAAKLTFNNSVIDPWQISLITNLRDWLVCNTFVRRFQKHHRRGQSKNNFYFPQQSRTSSVCKRKYWENIILMFMQQSQECFSRRGKYRRFHLSVDTWQKNMF